MSLDNSAHYHGSSPGPQEFVQVVLKLKEKKSVTNDWNRETCEIIYYTNRTSFLGINTILFLHIGKQMDMQRKQQIQNIVTL